ncbi:unnamed protein product [Boreogadus saida]
MHSDIPHPAPPQQPPSQHCRPIGRAHGPLPGPCVTSSLPSSPTPSTPNFQQDRRGRLSSCQMRFDGPLHVSMNHDNPERTGRTWTRRASRAAAANKETGRAGLPSLPAAGPTDTRLMDSQFDRGRANSRAGEAACRPHPEQEPSRRPVQPHHALVRAHVDSNPTLPCRLDYLSVPSQPDDTHLSEGRHTLPRPDSFYDLLTGRSMRSSAARPSQESRLLNLINQT